MKLIDDIDEERWIQLAKLAEVGLSLSAIIHEARQPLSIAKMALQILGDKVEKDAVLSDHVKDALGGVDRSAKMLEHSRDFFRPSAGEKIPQDITELAKELLSLLLNNLRHHGATVVTRIESGLPHISVEKSKIEQLLFNLLVNARDAIAEVEGGRIVLIVRSSEDGGVELIVADSGPGIDSSVTSKIFDPFFSTKSSNKGTGLGLYISKRIAAQHDAELSIMGADEIKALNEGDLSTAFQVVLGRSERISASPLKGSLYDSIEDQGQVLIVDDEEVVLKLLGLIVKDEGLNSIRTTSGEEALTLLQNTPFEMLIVDKNLPSVSGLEIARVARRLQLGIPILVITGFASEESVQEAAALGVDDYIIKPIDVMEFRKTLKKHLHPELSQMSNPSKRPSRPVTRTTIPPAPNDPIETEIIHEDSMPEILEASDEEIDIGVSVVLIDASANVRRVLASILTELGCAVAAFPNAKQAGAHVGSNGFDMLVAAPKTLEITRHWLFPRSGKVPLGAIAIMEKGGVDNGIKAIHLGARGILTPPFDVKSVTAEFSKIVSRLIEDRKKGY
ncbi:MAG: response regulator [Deltaproteobacteria bacterium]|nr:response regulator [Deltaproteobacteria bacterium]